MNVFYIKLKTGEDLLAIHNPIVDDTSDMVLLEGPIHFEADEETGVSLASYWISYSDTKNTNISLNDVYFFGKASETATTFYTTFYDQMTERKAAAGDVPVIDMSDEELLEEFTKMDRVLH